MRKIVFFDIDGTLLDCFGGITDITPIVKKAIRNLQAQGNYVFIATGRPYAFLSEVILNFGFDGFILANGSHIIFKGETIYNQTMDKKFVEELVDKLEEHEIQYILQGKTYSYMKNDCKEFYEFYDSIGISRKYLKSHYRIEEIDIHKVEMLCNTKASRDVCLTLLSGYSQCQYFNSIEERFFELNLKKNTKATAILEVLEKLNIPLEKSYAFGDGKNDVEMLSTVGCGIAMGNAGADVKKYANEVTDTVHNDGVAVGIERYVI